MSGEGYQVDPAALQQTANGINDTIGALKNVGIDEAAETGRGFSGMSMSGMQVGHQGLQQAFSGFCERWSWGVRTLVQDGTQFAQRLGLNAGTYYQMEQYGVGVLKDAVNAVAGDPHATNQQVESGSFSDIINKDTPDFSAASWQQTGQNAATTWSGVGRDVMEGEMGVNKTIADTVGLGSQFQNAENQLFGPPPQTH